MRVLVLLFSLMSGIGLAHATDVAGRFDFYVLSLSWSPTHCEVEGRERGDLQCDVGRRLGFMVHGLWPQYERGYPANCPTDEALRAADIAGVADLVPDAGLVRHEWRKHGSCSGLSPADYLATLRNAAGAVRIPQAFQRPDNYVMVSPGEVEAAFMAANPGLRAEGIAITCEGRRLEEVRVCLTRGLDFRACEEVDRRGCRIDKLVLPPVR
jgi:ribonuclease T2